MLIVYCFIQQDILEAIHGERKRSPVKTMVQKAATLSAASWYTVYCFPQPPRTPPAISPATTTTIRTFASVTSPLFVSDKVQYASATIRGFLVMLCHC